MGVGEGFCGGWAAAGPGGERLQGVDGRGHHGEARPAR